jgi:hypothetical protein
MPSNPPDPFLNERIRPGDPYFNYCHWPYDPPASGIGKLRASALLMHVIRQMPASEWLAETIHAIQAGIGNFRSVYGVKRVDGQWALEVYIYDYEREDRIVSIERLAGVCQQHLKLPTTVGSHIPYFMFSFDLDENVAAAGGLIEVVHVYVGNPGSTVSSGISYGFTDATTQPELENFYFFFDAANRSEIEDKVRCSAMLNNPCTLERDLLRPELMDCGTICLANKRTCNTVYFSGVNVQQFLFFLEWQHYPDDFQHFVRSHQNELDHLLYDVGIDYRINDNAVHAVKTGFYGVF